MLQILSYEANQSPFHNLSVACQHVSHTLEEALTCSLQDASRSAWTVYSTGLQALQTKISEAVSTEWPVACITLQQPGTSDTQLWSVCTSSIKTNLIAIGLAIGQLRLPRVPELPQVQWPTSLFLPLVLISLALIFIAVKVYESRSAGLDSIPGPWLARYTNFWALYRAVKVDDTGKHGLTKPQHYRKLQSIYGDVVRTGPRTITLMDPNVVPLVYKVRGRLEKGDAYIPFRQPGVTTSLLSIRDDDTHGRYRKLVANAYSMSSMMSYEASIDEMILRLLDVFEKHNKSKYKMNLSLWGYYFCFDVVSKVTMGKEMGFMHGNGQDVFGLLGGVHAFGRYVGPVAQAPWLHYVLKDNFVLRKTKPSPFHKAIRDSVNSRLASFDRHSARHGDLLSHFAEAHQLYPDMMTARQTTIQAGGNLIAGALSPGKTFETLFKWLAVNQGAQERLYQELKANNVSVPATYNETKDLPYLSGVLREAERLHTAASFTLERVTGPTGLDLPGGLHIPSGINVGCSIETTNSDQRVYGADAEEFNPDRWFQGSHESTSSFKERMRVIETTNLTFGQGSRTCIGKNVFKLEAWKGLASVVLQYKFRAITSNTDDLFVFVDRREKA